MNAELINVGNELLLGLVTNTHAAYLGQKLAELGFLLERQVCVADDAVQIENAVREAVDRADIVFTTGGLGPTSDDMTASVIGKMFGLRFRIDEKVQKTNEEWFKKRGVAMPQLVKHQALVPEGAVVLYNDHGTAPGFILPMKGERPPIPPGRARPRPASSGAGARWIVVLPGPPRELKPMFDGNVSTFLREKFPDIGKVHWRVLRVAEMGESTVQERVEPKLREKFPALEIAYSARPGEVDLRLLSATSEHEVLKAEEEAKAILGKHVFGNGSTELEQVVTELLRKLNKTVTCAESCTGGALANRLTNTPGSSAVFKGGWVTYTAEFKIRELGVRAETIKAHGEVSEDTAHEMAKGAREKANADFALSVTGIAGPGGAKPDKPVGMVFIGLATKTEVEVWREIFPLDRWTFKWRVAQYALNRLRLELLK